MSIKSSLGRQLGTQFDTVFDVVKSNPIYDKAGGSIPSLDLNFAKSKSLLDGRSTKNKITFTHASSGTYVGSDGLIKTATKNLIPHSQQIGLSGFWGINNPSNGVLTLDNAIAPDGTLTATTVVASSNFYGPIEFIGGLSASTDYTFSVWLKNNSATLPVRPNIFGYFAQFLNGELTNVNPNITTSSVEEFSDGWYRISLTASSGAGGALSVAIYGNDGADFECWGAQLEQSDTVGEYVKTTGTINSAPRFDHDPTTGESLGLLMEESRTNLLQYSEDFTNSYSYWGSNAVNGTITTNQAAAPDGTVTANLYTENTNTSGRYFVKSISFTSGTFYTVSIWAKQASGTRYLGLVLLNAAFGSNCIASFTLSGSGSYNISGSGTGTTANIQQFSNGWYRCSLTSQATVTTSAGVQFRLSDSPTSGTSNYTGDDASGIYIWGSQLEEGSFPTSYIPTSGSEGDRSADVMSISGSNFSSWYRQDEGTVFVNQTSLSTVPQDFATLFQFKDATATNVLFIRKRPGFSQWVASGENSLFMTRTIIQPSVLSVAYKTDDAAFAAEGTLTNDNSCTIDPNKVELVIGSSTGSASYMNGTISRFTYWPARLPDSTLQTITQ